jgi:hypothetical protein
LDWGTSQGGEKLAVRPGEDGENSPLKVTLLLKNPIEVTVNGISVREPWTKMA